MAPYRLRTRAEQRSGLSVAWVVEGSQIKTVLGKPAVTARTGGLMTEAPNEINETVTAAPAKVLVFNRMNGRQSRHQSERCSALVVTARSLAATRRCWSRFMTKTLLVATVIVASGIVLLAGQLDAHVQSSRKLRQQPEKR